MGRGRIGFWAVVLVASFCAGGCERERHRSSTALHEAVRRGDKVILEEMLADGYDVNAVDERSGRTALCTAARIGNTDLARILISHGARADHVTMAEAVGGWGESQPSEKPMIDLLLAHGAPAGGSGLVSAVVYNRLDLAEYLISKGADVNAKGLGLNSSASTFNDPEKDGSRPLFAAVDKRNPKMAELLLQHGADPTLPGESGFTAAQMAKRTGDSELIKVFEAAKAATRPRGPK